MGVVIVIKGFLPFWRKFLARGLERIFGKSAGGFINPFFVDNYDPEFDVIGKEE